MKKNRIEKLIPIANQILLDQHKEMQDRLGKETDKEKKKKIQETAILQKKNDQYVIKSNYDAKVSGFGIAVAMSGLRPALAMYFSESGDVKTRPILEVIAKIITKDDVYVALKDTSAEGLLEHALNLNDSGLKELKKYVLEASIALKQIVRTYELV